MSVNICRYGTASLLGTLSRMRSGQPTLPTAPDRVHIPEVTRARQDQRSTYIKFFPKYGSQLGRYYALSYTRSCSRSTMLSVKGEEGGTEKPYQRVRKQGRRIV